jgi:hypothetical protein
VTMLLTSKLRVSSDPHWPYELKGSAAAARPAAAAACEAVNISHDCGEGSVVDPGKRRSLDERGELGQERHAGAPEPPPSGGNAPICWNTCKVFSSSQCSTSMPSSVRQMSMDRISTALPLAGMPMKSPLCVPR